MPNGISCAYFAARNHIYGKKEDNPFKEGIAGVQTARTIDAVAKCHAIKGPIGAPITNFFNGAASIGKKIVYPLIIGSGIYNTVKSDDKVRTGASQALGISTMYAFEKICETGLNKLSSFLSNNSKFSNNKYLKGLWYFAKGMTFVAASLGGYNVGSKAAESFVDEFRAKKVNSSNKKTNALEEKVTFPIEDNLKESQIFADMKL